MAKAKLYKSQDGQTEQVWICCPGCNCQHGFTIKQPGFVPWTFNGDFEKPTFSPSMLVFASNPEIRCHSYVKDGKIQFLSDCFHQLKNKTVDLPDME